MKPAPDSIESVLPKARKLNRSAVDVLLRHYYSRVSRLARALCGQESTGKSVVQIIMNQSLHSLPSWRTQTQAANWFTHHTILKCREFTTAIPNPAEDSLIRGSPNPSPQFIAFIRAIRLLPYQQREAFLLFRAEKLDPRPAAVAMDCSTAAANNHLAAAEKSLPAIAGDAFNSCTEELVRLYSALSPPEDLIIADLTPITAKVSRKRFVRFLKRIVILAILAAVTWMIWRISRMIVI